MGRADEDQPEQCALEECCCSPTFLKESKGIRQESQMTSVLMKGLRYFD